MIIPLPPFTSSVAWRAHCLAAKWRGRMYGYRGPMLLDWDDVYPTPIDAPVGVERGLLIGHNDFPPGSTKNETMELVLL